MNTIDFNNKTILITGGAGFIGSNLAYYFQKHFPKSKVVVFDCFRSNETFENGNLKSLGHYKNLIDFNGDIICGNLNSKSDFKSGSIFFLEIEIFLDSSSRKDFLDSI